MIGGTPSPMGLVARNELRRHLRSFRYLVGSLLLISLSGLVSWLGHADHRLRVDAHEATGVENQARLAGITTYSFLRPVVSDPPEALSIFERGVTGRAGRDVVITPFRVPARATGEHRGNPYLSRWLDLDLTTVVAVVFGLLALLLTFDALVGERSRQRLDILWASGCTPRALLVGKFVGVLLALAASLAVALGLPIAVLFATGALGTDPDTLWRLLALILVYLVYGSAMALLGLWISLRAPSEPRSLAYAVLAWLGLVFLLPQLTAAVSEVWIDLHHDPRSVDRQLAELDAELESRLESLWASESLRVEPSGHTAPVVIDTWTHEVLRRLGSARYYDSMERYHREEIRLGRLHAELRHDLLAQQHARLQDLARPLEYLGLLSPAEMLESSAAALAGTSMADHEVFLDRAREYRRNLLVELEARGVLGTRPWFTDDPAEALPWVSFLGLRPDDVDRSNISEMASAFRSEEVQAKVEAELARRSEPPFLLDLSWLPELAPNRGGGSLLRIAQPGLALVALLLTLGFLVQRSQRTFLEASRPGAPAVPSDPGPMLDPLPDTDENVSGISAVLGPVAPRGDSKSRKPSGSVGLLESELLEIVVRPRWRIVAVTVVVLMTLACLLHGLHARPMAEDHASVRIDYEATLDGVSLAELAELEHPALRPPAAQGFVADGGERTMPGTYTLMLSSWQLPNLTTPGRTLAELSPSAAPDWSSVVWVVLSLSAFLLGYDSLCGRQLERLVLLVSFGTRRTTLLTTRWLALVLALAAPFAVGAVLGLLVLAFVGGSAPPLDGAKILSFLLLALLGLAFFAAATLAVSAWFGRADQALVTLVLIWVTAVVVIPSGSAILVLRLDPVPTERELWASIEDIRRQLEAVEGSSDWRPDQWARADDFAVERRSARLQSERHRKQVALVREFTHRQLRQAELARRFSYLSPVALFADTGERLIGAGLYRQLDFVEQAELFEDRLRIWASRVDRADPESPHLHFFPRYLSSRGINPADLPRFEFEEPSLAEGWRRIRGPLMLVFGSILLIGLLARWAVDRRMSRPSEPSFYP